MSRILPILFNTDMVQAILDGRKTVTRRMVKYKYNNTEMKMRTDKYGTCLIEIQKAIEGETHGKNPDGSTWHKLLPYIEKNPPCSKGDILYVRETWTLEEFYDGEALVKFKAGGEKQLFYETEGELYHKLYKFADDKWIPSIFMPKAVARIWLKVTDVRVERLHDMTLDDFLSEGIVLRPEAFNDPENAYQQARSEFASIWDSTIRKSQTDLNPWVWVIAFERCGEPESCALI